MSLFETEQPYSFWGAAHQKHIHFSKIHWSISVAVMNRYVQSYQKIIYIRLSKEWQLGQKMYKYITLSWGNYKRISTNILAFSLLTKVIYIGWKNVEICYPFLGWPHPLHSNISDISCNYERFFTKFSKISLLIRRWVPSENIVKICYPFLGAFRPILPHKYVTP